MAAQDKTMIQTAIVGARRYKATVEYSDATGPEWWLMDDKGCVDLFDTAQAAFNHITRRAARYNHGVTITTIEWRNVPEGFVPPKEVVKEKSRSTGRVYRRRK